MAVEAVAVTRGVEGGTFVAFVRLIALGVPRLGVVRVGLVAKTNAPEPVSSVTAVARLALLGVARNVAIPAPRPLMPVDTGKPVPLVNVMETGVPSEGLTSVGDVARTTLPVPVTGAETKPVPLLTGISPAPSVVVSVISGLVGSPSEVPAKPFAEATDTDCTVPVPAVIQSKS